MHDYGSPWGFSNKGEWLCLPNHAGDPDRSQAYPKGSEAWKSKISVADELIHILNLAGCLDSRLA